MMEYKIGIVSDINKETGEGKFDLYVEECKSIQRFKINYGNLLAFNVGEIFIFNPETRLNYIFNIYNNDSNEIIMDSLLNMYNIYFKNLFDTIIYDEFNGISRENINIILDSISNYLELIRKDLNNCKTR